jgi:hypothetical protein
LSGLSVDSILYLQLNSMSVNEEFAHFLDCVDS